MKYITLKKLTVKQVQLIRCALANYQEGVENLKQWKIDEGDFDKALEDIRRLRLEMEVALSENHADYQYKVGKSEPKPLR